MVPKEWHPWSSKRGYHIMRRIPTIHQQNNIEQELQFQTQNIPLSKKLNHLVKIRHPWSSKRGYHIPRKTPITNEHNNIEQ